MNSIVPFVPLPCDETPSTVRRPQCVAGCAVEAPLSKVYVAISIRVEIELANGMMQRYKN
jgi:hypothetical protein